MTQHLEVKGCRVTNDGELPDRVAGLGKALWRAPPPLDSLRYQLLFGVAAALVRARMEGAQQAVFLVHQVIGAPSDDNLNDMNVLIAALDNTFDCLTAAGGIVGPVRVSGVDPSGRIANDVDLFIALAVRAIAPSRR